MRSWSCSTRHGPFVLMRSSRKGSRTRALLDLQRDGLVEITQPLKGSAAAHRTVRVAALTAAGLRHRDLGQTGIAAARGVGAAARRARMDWHGGARGTRNCGARRSTVFARWGW